jgi:para-aminobenzoate synthetase component 1
VGATVWEVSDYRPLSDVFELLKDDEQVAFLDSSEQGEQGRFSIVGCKPFLTIEQVDGACLVNGAPADTDFFDTLGDALREYHEPNETHLPLTGGALGYLGYDFGRELNGVPTRHAPKASDVPLDSSSSSPAFATAPAPAATPASAPVPTAASASASTSAPAVTPSSAPTVPASTFAPSPISESTAAMPDAQMVFYDVLLIEDHEQSKLYACAQGQATSPDKARAWVESLMASCPEAPRPSRNRTLAAFSSRFTEQEYQQALARMVEYMLDGHIYVANMTQQLTMAAPQPPYDLYRYLRTFNPAPFSAYLRGPGFDVCCSSMERFLFVRDGHAVTRPIKGTRPRGRTPDEDARNRDELFASPKDNSELLMIVDLERNDLSLSCKPGTVFVHPEFVVEAYPTVFHLVATVEGQLRKDATALDVVRNAFPGGSITGAPKIRAMEIIDELERSARGLYTGSIGYFSNAGDCDLNVVIRTLVCRDGVATLGVGGGITVESDFDFEYQETLQKAYALREAVGSPTVEGDKTM